MILGKKLGPGTFGCRGGGKEEEWKKSSRLPMTIAEEKIISRSLLFIFPKSAPLEANLDPGPPLYKRPPFAS